MQNLKYEKIMKIMNQKDCHGNTPLHYSVMNNNQPLTDFFIKLGADKKK